MLKGVTLA